MMKNYIISVNGEIFDVTVEEAGEASVARIPAPAPRIAAPAAAVQAEKIMAPPAAPVVAPAVAAPTAPAASAGSGKTAVTTGTAGTVFAIKASVGQSVQAGDTIVVLEAMKMEIAIVAPEAGVVASIDVKEGDVVKTGAALATLG